MVPTDLLVTKCIMVISIPNQQLIYLIWRYIPPFCRACSMAKQAFNDAADELEKVDEELYPDTNLIMKLIKDNLTLWAEIAEEGGKKF